MTARHHQPPRPVYRTVAAARLVTDLGRVEDAVLAAVIEMRGQGLDGLADALNTELGHVKQVRVAAAARLRVER